MNSKRFLKHFVERCDVEMVCMPRKMLGRKEVTVVYSITQ